MIASAMSARSRQSEMRRCPGPSGTEPGRDPDRLGAKSTDVGASRRGRKQPRRVGVSCPRHQITQDHCPGLGACAAGCCREQTVPGVSPVRAARRSPTAAQCCLRLRSPVRRSRTQCELRLLSWTEIHRQHRPQRQLSARQLGQVRGTVLRAVRLSPTMVPSNGRRAVTTGTGDGIGRGHVTR